MDTEILFHSAITPDLFEIFLEGLATAAVSACPRKGRTLGSPGAPNHSPHTHTSEWRWTAGAYFQVWTSPREETLIITNHTKRRLGALKLHPAGMSGIEPTASWWCGGIVVLKVDIWILDFCATHSKVTGTSAEMVGLYSQRTQLNTLQDHHSVSQCSRPSLVTQQQVSRSDQQVAIWGFSSSSTLFTYKIRKQMTAINKTTLKVLNFKLSHFWGLELHPLNILGAIVLVVDEHLSIP